MAKPEPNELKNDQDPGTEEGADDQDQDQKDEPRPLELYELTGAGEALARAHRKDDFAEFFENVGTDPDLIGAEADAAIGWLESQNQTVLSKDLRARQDAVRVEQARVDEERLKNDREARLVALREQRAKDRLEAEEKQRQEKVDAELLELIEKEERGGDQGDPELDRANELAEQVVDESVEPPPIDRLNPQRPRCIRRRQARGGGGSDRGGRSSRGRQQGEPHPHRHGHLPRGGQP